MGRYGISNSWKWRPILKSGKLGRVQSGYDNEGKFTEYKGEFEIQILLKNQCGTKGGCLKCGQLKNPNYTVKDVPQIQKDCSNGGG